MRIAAVALVLVPALSLLAQAPPAPTAAPAQPAHIALDAKELKWGDPPPVLPKGARMAVLSGDPGKSGPFVIRLQMPAGYKIAPHWHPTDEHGTVLSGTFSLGMGEIFDKSKGKTFGPGGYAMLPAEMRHYAWTKSGATVQVHGMGPFVLNYVHPADDPSKGAAARK
jgi:hypothetical protein